MRWDDVCARACDGSCAGTRFECGFGFARAAGEGRAHLTDVLVLLCALRFFSKLYKRMQRKEWRSGAERSRM